MLIFMSFALNQGIYEPHQSILFLAVVVHPWRWSPHAYWHSLLLSLSSLQRPLPRCDFCVWNVAKIWLSSSVIYEMSYVFWVWEITNVKCLQFLLYLTVTKLGFFFSGAIFWGLFVMGFVIIGLGSFVRRKLNMEKLGVKFHHHHHHQGRYW